MSKLRDFRGMVQIEQELPKQRLRVEHAELIEGGVSEEEEMAILSAEDCGRRTATNIMLQNRHHQVLADRHNGHDRITLDQIADLAANPEQALLAKEREGAG